MAALRRAIDGMRDAIDARIRAVVPGDKGAIASALITGKRDAISAPVNEAMYMSSLAHVLSISGYHMAVVAGVVFFVLRALLALIPAFAGRYPIKKWATAVEIVLDFRPIATDLLPITSFQGLCAWLRRSSPRRHPASTA